MWNEMQALGFAPALAEMIGWFGCTSVRLRTVDKNWVSKPDEPNNGVLPDARIAKADTGRD